MPNYNASKEKVPVVQKESKTVFKEALQADE